MPPPASAAELYRQLQEFDFLLVRPPLKDVDKAIEFSPGAVEINAMIFELLKAGKLTVYRTGESGQIMILRIVPETLPISARASSKQRMTKSMSSLVWPADICVLILALSLGTTG